MVHFLVFEFIPDAVRIFVRVGQARFAEIPIVTNLVVVAKLIPQATTKVELFFSKIPSKDVVLFLHNLLFLRTRVHHQPFPRELSKSTTIAVDNIVTFVVMLSVFRCVCVVVEDTGRKMAVVAAACACTAMDVFLV